MRIVFIGQAPFGGETLETLLAQGENIVGVITIPDQPHQKHPNPVKTAAEKNNIPVLQTRLLKTPEAIEQVRSWQPDLLVLAFVTAFVPREMIELSARGGINYHPSLLPKYRGGSAINWAVINGERETGVSIHFIDEGVDTGPVLLQEKVAIAPDDTVKSLYFNKLYPLGVRLMAEAVSLIRHDTAEPVVQDEKAASFQPVITEKDTVIDWRQPTEAICNLIRGADPAPGAVSQLRGRSCKIYDASPAAGSGSPGLVLCCDAGSITVATGDGAISISTIQPAGEKKQAAAEFIRSASLSPGDRFSA